MKRLEATGLLVGAILVGFAVTAFDWRLGIALAGVVLIASSLELRRRPS